MKSEILEIFLFVKRLKTKFDYAKKKKEFIYIPRIESLQQLLTNVNIAKTVFRIKKKHKEDVFYDVYDGMLYKNDAYFSGKDHTLEFIIYYDDLGVYNPLGSKAGKHKIDLFYYTLGNINPKFRSEQCAIRLLAICNTKFVKKYGIDKVLTPVVDDVNKLCEGYSRKILENEILVFGKVLMCLGDTLGQHLWGRFKEGVGVSKYLNKNAGFVIANLMICNCCSEKIYS